jgi:hypothetical protein
MYPLESAKPYAIFDNNGAHYFNTAKEQAYYSRQKAIASYKNSSYLHSLLDWVFWIIFYIFLFFYALFTGQIQITQKIKANKNVYYPLDPRVIGTIGWIPGTRVWPKFE